MRDSSRRWLNLLRRVLCLAGPAPDPRPCQPAAHPSAAPLPAPQPRCGCFQLTPTGRNTVLWVTAHGINLRPPVEANR